MVIHAGLGQGHDAPRHRSHVDQLDRRAAAAPVPTNPEPAHLGRAASDVDQQPVGDLGLEQVFAAGERQPRLLGRPDDLEAEAGAGLHQAEEILAVAGAAAGLRGDMACARNARTLDLGGADIQRLQGAVDRVAAQRPAQRHALAQPDWPGIGVDHVEAHDRRPGHQEPAVVGAEIDGGERVRETTAVPASLLPLFRREVPGHSELLFIRSGW
jgi:hypothetical protein